MHNWTQADFIGAHPILDFVNTVNDQNKSREENKIGSWAAFQAWAEMSSMFSPEQQKLIFKLQTDPKSDRLLPQIHGLREVIHQGLQAVITPHTNENALRILEANIHKGLQHARLAIGEQGYRWTANTAQPDWLISVLALSAHDLLCSVQIHKLRECHRCSWMFLNTGRGKGRRWCSMETCGNRAKSAAFRSKNT